MGSVNETIEETVDHMNAGGEKVGVVKVRLYRPFSAKALLEAIPKSVKREYHFCCPPSDEPI